MKVAWKAEVRVIAALFMIAFFYAGVLLMFVDWQVHTRLDDIAIQQENMLRQLDEIEAYNQRIFLKVAVYQASVTERESIYTQKPVPLMTAVNADTTEMLLAANP